MNYFLIILISFPVILLTLLIISIILPQKGNSIDEDDNDDNDDNDDEE
ncbi:MAG TPA: hypothetical protein P5344_02550 [Candidatus Dojkabacteria bacterium]|nr:hypothetical protein [Candidatus Dojkabacteria bacterium]